MKETEKLVREYCAKLIEDVRRDKKIEVVNFPEFGPGVDYIYDSLGYFLSKYTQPAVSAIVDILHNVARMKAHTREEAYQGYLELVNLSLALDEKLMNMYVAENPDKNRKPSCKRGCAWCCHQSIQLNGLEGEALWKKVPRTSAFKLQQEAFARGGMKGTNHQRTWVKALGLKNSRCPFLGENNDCTIYEQRPLVCRYYIVYDPPETCHPHSVPDRQTMGLPVIPIILEAAMMEAYGVTFLQTPGMITKL